MTKPEQYLLTWDDFAKKHPYDQAGRSPILYPIIVDIDENGEVTRDRLDAGKVKEIYVEASQTMKAMAAGKCINETECHVPSYMVHAPDMFDDFDEIFRDYIKFFGPQDGVQGPGVASPLDLKINRPVWLMFYLPKTNWKFSKHIQYSVENDRDDQARNFEKICVLDDWNALLVANRCRSAPEGLKYNLHLTISQTNKDGDVVETDIIIDPGSENSPTPPFDGHGD